MSDLADRAPNDATTDLEVDDSARRDELARQLEEAVATAWDWAGEVESDQAHEIAQTLEDIYDRFTSPTEETDVGRDEA